MNALDELIEPESLIDRTYVERRIEDWRRRIARLYDDVSRWLPKGWTASDGGSVPMHEELMQRFDLPSQAMPILSLHHEGSAVGKFEPRGLWIIGANGRVDLTLPGRHFLLVDRSDSFEDADWHVASIEARRDERAISRDVIRDMVK